jgi:lipid II:glycine glycyltransferase (peptidoglycan interpeptide bridge formation enzyme)
MGDDNQLTDNSINIGQSFNQRQERIAALDDLIGKIKGAETKNDASEKAEKSLTKVRDELADEAEPNEPMIKKWLENAKNVMVTGALSYEVIEAGKKLWEMFGM